MSEKFDPVHVMSTAFGLASLGGLAALLRSKQPLSARVVASALLYSGLVGLTIALCWHNYFAEQNNVYFLLGVSALAGIGGVTVVDFIIQLAKNGGVNISIRADDKEDKQ